MSDYPKIIERPYRVYTGEPEYMLSNDGSQPLNRIYWTYRYSFNLESDAEAMAERLAEENQFVKIEKKETE